MYSEKSPNNVYVWQVVFQKVYLGFLVQHIPILGAEISLIIWLEGMEIFFMENMYLIYCILVFQIEKFYHCNRVFGIKLSQIIPLVI